MEEKVFIGPGIVQQAIRGLFQEGEVTEVDQRA